LQLLEYEQRVNRILADDYRDLFRFHAQIAIQRSQREAYGEQLRALFEQVIVGKITVDRLLEAQRFWASALQAEYNNIASYNAALARFQHAKGTILLHDNVQIQEGALPECARERAVENQRQKDKALVLCERAGAGAYERCGSAACGCASPKSMEKNGSLQGVFESMPTVGADMLKALPGGGDAKKPDAKIEESKTEDRTPSALIELITPAATAAPEEKPIQSLPPPQQYIPKLDGAKTSLPLPPPPPKE
jgi:hypothetical protein